MTRKMDSKIIATYRATIDKETLKPSRKISLQVKNEESTSRQVGGAERWYSQEPYQVMVTHKWRIITIKEVLLEK